jgi:mannosyltransferase
MTANTQILHNRIVSWFENLRAKSATQYLILTAVTIFAALLRFYRMDQWSFWRDEIAQINRALGHFNLETILSQWWRPPISVLLTGLSLNSFEVNEWSARLPSVLLGLISIPVIYFVIRQLFNRQVALTVSFLFMVSPWHIFWSQNARFYTSLMLLYFLASIAFYLFIERGQVKYLLLFVIFFFFAISERLIAILLVPSLIAYFILLWVMPFEKPTTFKINRLAWLLLAGPIFALLELYSYITTGTTRLAFAYDTFVARTIDDPFRIVILILFAIGIPMVIMAMLSTFYIYKNKSRLGLFLFVNALVPVAFLAFISMFSFVVERYAFVTLPAWIILAAYFIVETARRHKHTLFLTAGLILVLISDASVANLMYFQINHGNRPEWEKAFVFVADKTKEGDIIISSVSEIGNYYLEQDVLWLGDLNTADIRNGNQRYWFVLDSENSWFTPEQKNWVERNTDLLQVYYLRVREEINIKIYLYQPGYENPLG